MYQSCLEGGRKNLTIIAWNLFKKELLVNILFEIGLASFFLYFVIALIIFAFTLI